MKLNINFSAKFRKIIAITSIACVSTAALIGITAILGIKYGDWMGFVLLTLLDFFVVSLFCLNCIEAINRKNTFGYLSALFLLLTGLLFLIQIWGAFIAPDTFNNSVFLKIIVVLAAISVFFSVVVSKAITLRRYFLTVQIITYALLGICLLRIVLLILAPSWNEGLKFLNTPLIIAGIVTIVLFIVLSIRGKMIGKEDDNADLMTISVKEYTELNDKIKELQAKVKELQKYAPVEIEEEKAE